MYWAALGISLLVGSVAGCVTEGKVHFHDLQIVSADDILVSASRDEQPSSLYQLEAKSGHLTRIPIQAEGDLRLPLRTADGTLHFVVKDTSGESIWTYANGRSSRATTHVPKVGAFGTYRDGYLAFVTDTGQTEAFDPGRPCAYPTSHLMLVNHTGSYLFSDTPWCGERGLAINARGDVFVDATILASEGPRLWRIDALNHSVGRMTQLDETPGFGPDHDYYRWECIDPGSKNLQLSKNSYSTSSIAQSTGSTNVVRDERVAVVIFNTTTGNISSEIPAKGAGCLLPDRTVSLSRASGCLVTCIDRIEEYDAQSGNMRIVAG